MRGLFVTGTDTGVGKTVLSAVLASSRGWGYWKPIQTGTESDTAEVARLSTCDIHDPGIRLPEPLSPHLAAERAGTRIDLNEVIAMAPTEGDWIVEGAGGVLVPVNAEESMIDLMALLGLPVVVAARSTLGTINHTVLTLEALRARGLVVERVIMIGEASRDNRAAIATYGRVQVDELPWFDPLTADAVQACKL